MENLKIFADAVGRISVAVPFSRGFIAAARSISGRWDARAKVWFLTRATASAAA